MAKSTYSIDELKSTWGKQYTTAPSFYFKEYAFRITFNTMGRKSYKMMDGVTKYFNDLNIPTKSYITWARARIYVDDIAAVYEFTKRYDIIIEEIAGPANAMAFDNRHNDSTLLVKKEYRDRLWHDKYEYKMTIVMDQYYIDNWDMLKGALLSMTDTIRITSSGDLGYGYNLTWSQAGAKRGTPSTCTIHIKTEDDLAMLRLTSNIKPKATYQCIVSK